MGHKAVWTGMFLVYGRALLSSGLATDRLLADKYLFKDDGEPRFAHERAVYLGFC